MSAERLAGVRGKEQVAAGGHPAAKERQNVRS